MSLGDWAKNVVTFGKHNEAKALARRYEASCKYLERLHQEHENLVANLETGSKQLAEAREKAVDQCQKHWDDISELLIAVKVNFPVVERYFDPNLNKLLNGITDSQFGQAYKNSQAGSGLNLFLQYNNHRMMQSQLHRYDPFKPARKNDNTMYYMGAAAVVMELLNVVFTGINEAKELIREITAKEAEVNKHIANYRSANANMGILFKNMAEDVAELNSKCVLMVTLKEDIIEKSNRYRFNPNTYRKVRGFFREQMGLPTLPEKELNRLTASYNAFFHCTELITKLVNKEFEHETNK